MKRSISMMLIFAIFTASLVFSTYAEAAIAPYVDASPWAVPELDKAVEYGFITERIKDKMNASITREEFSEMAVVLYEKYTGVKAVEANMNTFVDTVNPEVFKAYNLKIVNGTNKYWRLFSPEDFSTREQVAVMIYRAIKAMNPGADLSTNGVGKFFDEDDISSWALESVRFMNKNGFMRDEDGRINPKGTCTREMAALITTRVYEKYLSGKSGDIAGNDGTGGADGNNAFYLGQIVVNDIEIYADNYRVKSEGGIDYILISAEKFKYAFKLPNAGYYTYPEVNIIGGSINVIWNNEAGVVMHADMREGSEEALINDIKVDLAIAPYSENGKMFIPVNVFIAARGMDSEESSVGGILYVQYKEDFPKADLVGTWSDSKIDLFARSEEIKAGVMPEASFSTAYMFRTDGTYGLRMVSSGSDNDIFIMQEGKYKIMGNTILCYDISETVYNGTPLALQYEDKSLENPQYLFIYNYEARMKKIEIGGFWLNRL